MKNRRTYTILVLSVCLSMVVSTLFGKMSAKAAPYDFDPDYVGLVQVSAGLSQPLLITNAGDGSGRLFVIERVGRIRIIKNGILLSTPFLDIDSTVNSTDGEQGLLALAFHPNYETNGKFYVAYTIQSGSVALSSFTRSQNNPDLADANSITPLLTIPHPDHTNHNGGTLAFGPDGFLYWSVGDGGPGGDPSNNAQNLTVLLGKILRLNVNAGSPYSIPSDNPFFNNPNAAIRKEIWAYGLRNPWRISFDRLTGDLYIGDVGQSVREEIDFQSASSNGGENYGWRVMEGSLCYPASSTCDPSGKVLPVAEYDHSLGCSVTGGHVYRGARYPSLYGYYFYADFCSGRLFSLRHSMAAGWESAQILDTAYMISSFGEDESGEVYLADYSGGKIYQLTYAMFADVAASHPFYRHIEAFYRAGLTVGCSQSPLQYCPDANVTRGEMAVFIERAMGNFNPPTNTVHPFDDVPYPGLEQFTNFIEEFYKDGITVGCSQNPLMYCPQNHVTRGEMAVFIERAIGNFNPPTNTVHPFDDVPYPGLEHFTNFIEQFYKDGITVGCQQNPLRYCPQNNVTRGEMAVFIVRAFNIPLQ